jgi:nucleoside-diphosphate-sugar epimerase
MSQRRTPEQDVVLVTGGSGYIGAMVVDKLAATGDRVRVVDSLLHGQTHVAHQQSAAGVEHVNGDLRDAAVRSAALADVSTVVHLAAIVGDPACARQPGTSEAVNVDATKALLEEARVAGVRRFIYASTCSNYGRMTDTAAPIDESGTLAPVSLYAEQKVRSEMAVLGHASAATATTCLRFATVYGVAPRMRFDLSINEFTRDLWAGRRLCVFGQQFWRPYVHVGDVAKAVRLVRDAPTDVVNGEVFNVGSSVENYRKIDIVALVRERISTGDVVFVDKDEDPRDYKVSFEKIRRILGFEPERSVRDGIAEVRCALDRNAFGDPFAPAYSN